MNSIPANVGDWSYLHEILAAFHVRAALLAALRLNIFDFIDEAENGTTAEEIAARASTNSRNTRLLLDALVGMNLVRKQNGKYTLTKLSAEFLVTTAPAYLGAFLLHFASFYEQFPTSIDDLVRQGPPVSMPDMAMDSMWAHSARQSASYQYGGEAQDIARIVSLFPEFPSISRMLDLGGGAGFFTMAIVSKHPSMKGVVLEQPAVAQVTQEFVRKWGLEDRVSIIAGDYTKHDFDGPYDLIFASSTLNFCRSCLDGLFSKIYQALTPGGIFMTHQDGLREERTQPATLVAEFLILQMLGDDFCFDEGEIAEAMLRAGFQTVRSFVRKSSMGEMAVDIGRKAGAHR